MVMLEILGQDRRSAKQRARALDRARDRDDTRAQLAAITAALREAASELEHADTSAEAPAAFWRRLDEAYLALDRYLAALLDDASIEPRCGPGCSTCCTDAPPILPIEALRMARALAARADGPSRMARAAEQAELFVALLERRGLGPALELADPRYREAQLAWRGLGHRCPILDDAGECSAYAARPLACRVHVHVEDPAHCDPASSRFSTAERPPVWGHPREAEVELALVRLGQLLGEAGGPTNLQVGLSRSRRRP